MGRPAVRRLAAALGAGALLLAACSGGGAEPQASPDAEAATTTAGPEPVSVAFVRPLDGDNVTSPVEVELAVTGIELAAAGAVRPGSGHLHLMVDVGCLPFGETIPDDQQHVHLDDGGTTVTVELEPGIRNLCAQLGDGSHAALAGIDFVTITVTG